MIAGTSTMADDPTEGLPHGAERSVLLVEDDPWLRPLLAELLADEGYRVIEAADGDVVASLAAEDPPDAIVLDLRLPRKSGLEVLAELRADPATAHVPVLVLSGEVDDLTRRILARREQRADGVIEKPLDLGEFFQRLEEVVQHHQDGA